MPLKLKALNRIYQYLSMKSVQSVMPDLIRHPETFETLDSGFRRNDNSL